MGEGLRLTLLGKPLVSRDEVPVTGFIYNKALALLIYLAVTRRPHSRDALAGLLWGEMPDANAKANLRKILAVLRDVAAPNLIIGRQTVAFNTESPYWLDTEVFQSKLLSLISPSLSAAGLSDKEVRLLDDAVKLYGGDFLEGFYVHDAPAFEEWVLPEREHLRQMVLQALYRLAAYCTVRGEYVRGIAYTGRLLALEPWSEEVHQQMMLLLALSGQRSAALEQFARCRRILAKEMGTQPNGDTLALYQRIKSGEITAQSSVVSAPQTSSRGIVRFWPAEATPFIGRAHELVTLTDRLTSPDCRLLTIVGLSGAGKTRLALQAAAATLSSFKDGASFVPLAAVTSSELLYPALANSLGLTAEHQRGSRTRVIDHLRDKQILLVLDQFEHLRDTAALLTDLLQRAPGAKVLVTSLERLNLRGEWTQPIQGLSLPASEQTGDILASDAVQLFIQGAHRARADCVPTPAELTFVSRICQLVEGIPLGIELASAWTRVLSCREIAREIERSYSFLVGGSQDVSERHRSLVAALDQSWNRLSEAERSVFRRLCVFRDGFTREAAAEVAGASLPLLVSLIDKCLVQSSSFGRYTIHKLVHKYGLERLSELPTERAEAFAGHSQYYTALLQRTSGRLLGMWEEDALPEIAAERENLRAAWEWALAHSRQETAASLAERVTSERSMAVKQVPDPSGSGAS